MANIDVTITAKLISLLSGQVPAITNDINKVGKAAEDSSKRAGAVADAIDRKIGGVFRGLARLATPLIALLAPIAAIAGAIRAINAAQESDAGERRLFLALNKNNDLLQYRLQLADQLAAKSIFDNDAIVAADARLTQLGVRASQMSGALQAIVDTATALGEPLEAVAEEFGKTLDGTAGRLAQKIPELQNVSEAALRNGEAFRIAGEKFKGYAAEFASSDFGRATVAQNKIGDAVEKIGKSLAIIKSRVLEGLVPVADAFAKFLSSDRATQFFQIFGNGIQFVLTKLGEIAAFLQLATFDEFVKTFTDSMLAALRIVRYVLLDTPIALINGLGNFVEARVAAFVSRMAAEVARLLSNLPLSGVGTAEVATAEAAAQAAANAASKSLADTVGASLFESFEGFQKSMSKIGGRIARRILEISERARAEAEAAEADAEDVRKSGERATIAQTQRENLAAFAAIFKTRGDLVRAGVKSEGKIELSELDSLLDQKKIKVADYARQRTELEIKPITEAIIAAQSAIGRLSITAAREVFTGKDAVPTLGRIRELYSVIVGLSATREEVEQKITEAVEKAQAAEDQRTSKAKETLDARTAELQIQNAIIAGHEKQAALLQLEADFAKKRRDDEAAGLNSNREFVALREQTFASQRRSTELQYDIAGAVSETDKAYAKYERTVRRAADLEQTGSMSSAEARQQQKRAFDELNLVIAESVRKLEELKTLQTDPAALERINDTIDEVKGKAKEIGDEYESLGEAIRESLRGPLEGLFTDLITGVGSLREAFASFFKNLASQFAQMAAQIAANQILSALFNGPNGTGNVFSSAINAVLSGASGRNSGGFIGDPVGPDRDSILAHLTSGEFVVRRSVAQANREFLAAFNLTGSIESALSRMGGSMPRGMPSSRMSGPVQLNAGGTVPISSSGGGSRPVSAYVVGSEAQARRMLANGEPALLEAIQRSPDKFRNALGLT